MNPVVEGRVRAKQDRIGDTKRSRVLPLLIHGDAAFIGQGVVAETLNLMSLEGYSTGGTLHVVVNNQVGFTTNYEDSRSTRYATDLARMLGIPIFHVNGEDPEAVAHVARLAVEYRQEFARDVVIDMYCYRKWGHNEGDEPRFTQPVMYAAIDRKATVRAAYVKTLTGTGKVTQEQADQLAAARKETLEAALVETRRRKYIRPHSRACGGSGSSYQGRARRERPRGRDRRAGAERSRRCSSSSTRCPRASTSTPSSIRRCSSRGGSASRGRSRSTGERPRVSRSRRSSTSRTPFD